MASTALCCPIRQVLAHVYPAASKAFSEPRVTVHIGRRGRPVQQPRLMPLRAALFTPSRSEQKRRDPLDRSRPVSVTLHPLTAVGTLSALMGLINGLRAFIATLNPALQSYC
jgi:hypothetical protein